MSQRMLSRRIIVGSHGVDGGLIRESDMKSQSYSCRKTFVSLVMTALWSVICGAAAAQVPTATVFVFVDYYVIAGRYFDDLDVLEDSVASERPERIRLVTCVDGAERATKAAAHRFRHLYLDLATASPDSSACETGHVRMVAINQRLGQRPFGIHDQAVTYWWTKLMP